LYGWVFRPGQGVYREVDDDLLAKLEAEQQRAGELAQQVEALPDPDQRRAMLEGLAAEWEEILEAEDPAVLSTRLREAGIRVLVEEGAVVRIAIG
jgi:hypothetical protein